VRLKRYLLGRQSRYMHRRNFLQNLIVVASVFTVDPERLLWVPGQKKIFIPPEPHIQSIGIRARHDIQMQISPDSRRWFPVEAKRLNETQYVGYVRAELLRGHGAYVRFVSGRAVGGTASILSAES
jgi:hypothetical protein